MSGIFYVHFYPSNWRSGCIGLTLEQEGFYVRACTYMWETGRRISLDDAHAAAALAMDVRMYRRVKGQLVAKGKLHVGEDGIYNERAELEFRTAQKAVDKARSKDVDSARRPDGSERRNGGDQVEGFEPSGSKILGDRGQTSRRLLGDFAETSGQSLGERSRKGNEINGAKKDLESDLDIENNIAPIPYTEQVSAREGRTEQGFDLKSIGVGRRATPGRRGGESIEDLDATADGFGLDTQVARELAAKAGPAKPYAYRLTLYANELADKHGLEKQVCREALKGNHAARKFVFAVVAGCSDAGNPRQMASERPYSAKNDLLATHVAKSQSIDCSPTLKARNDVVSGYRRWLK